MSRDLAAMADSLREKDELLQGFDVEAQKSLLDVAATTEAHEVATSFNARKAFHKVLLLIRSARIFAATTHDQGEDEEDHHVINPYVETGDDGFDLEAQVPEVRSPLLRRPANIADGTTNDFDARKAFRRVGLLIRSARLIFELRLGVNCTIPDHDNQHQLLPHQDSNITAASSKPTEGSTQKIPNAHSASTQHEHNITLQEQQIKYVTHEIVRKKDLQALRDFGGVGVIAVALNSDLEEGISCPQQIIIQQESIQPCHLYLFTIFPSFLAACNNYAIFLLFVAAALSIGFGIKENGWHLGWLNGVVLTCVILIVVFFTAIKSCLEEWSNKRLENSWRSKGRNMQVQVLREGCSKFLTESELEVGDIAFLKKGDDVPGDGIFISGECLEIHEGCPKTTTIDGDKPFLFYGSRVIDGIDARMLVTSTRMDTVWGETMRQAMEKAAESESKFESWIRKLNVCVYIFGGLQSILIIIFFFIRHELGKLDNGGGNRPDAKAEPAKVKSFTDAIRGILNGSRGTARVLTNLFSLSFLGITEGMSFVISVASIVWSRAILAHKALERDNLSCLKMASVTTICVDKFEGMAEDAIEIGKFYVGERFVSEKLEAASEVLEGLCDGIGTLHLHELHSDCGPKLLPLTTWANAQSGVRRESMNGQCKIIDTPSGHNPFKECCHVVIEKSMNERFYVHCRGPLKEILPLCSHHYGINGEKQKMDDHQKRKLLKANECMNTKEAEVIAFACKTTEGSDEASNALTNLIFVGMISIKKTKMEDTKEVISTLSQGGIRTILVSGNDVEELKIIGEKCGIFRPCSDNLAFTGEEFRGWSEEDKVSRIEKIRIMGNCLPLDKIDLINCLRKQDHVVALIGQSAWDAPALKQADIGLTNGTLSSTVARESCDITIWDDNCFRFLVYVIEKGRCYLGKIRTLIQLQVIFTGSSLLINLVAVGSMGDAPITTGQLFWLNLVVPLVGGLALLLTGTSTKEQITTLTANSSKKLMTKAMWRNIVIQASYQTSIFLILLHKGHAILGISEGSLKSMVYNGFFLCQIFNTVAAREPEKKYILSGLYHKNKWFWVGPILLLVCQDVFAGLEKVCQGVSGAEKVLGSSPELSWKLWAVCWLIGLGSWVVDLAGKTLFSIAK